MADYLGKKIDMLGDKEVSTLFTALARVEAGHQTAIRKMLEKSKE